MKEMAHTGNDCHRKYLGSRPVQRRGQRNGVVLLTVNHQRFRVRVNGNRCDSETAGSHPDQNQRIQLALTVQLRKSV